MLDLPHEVRWMTESGTLLGRWVVGPGQEFEPPFVPRTPQGDLPRSRTVRHENGNVDHIFPDDVVMVGV